MVFVPAIAGCGASSADGPLQTLSAHGKPTVDGAAVPVLAGLETAPAGARLHAIGDEGVPFWEIADVIGRQLDMPVRTISREDAPSHLGLFALFASMDMTASAALTEQRFGWHPLQPGRIADPEKGHYFNG